MFSVDIKNIIFLLLCFVSASHGCFNYECNEEGCNVVPLYDTSLSSEQQCQSSLEISFPNGNAICSILGNKSNKTEKKTDVERNAENGRCREGKKAYLCVYNCQASLCNHPIENLKTLKKAFKMKHFNKPVDCVKQLAKKLEKAFDEAVASTAAPTTLAPTSTRPPVTTKAASQPIKKEDPTSVTTEAPETTTNGSDSSSPIVSIICASLYYVICMWINIPNYV